MAKILLAMRQKILQKPMEEKIQSDTGFEVLSIEDLHLTADLCHSTKAEVVLFEVANKSPGYIEDVLEISNKVSKLCPNCKIIFLCDSKNEDIGERVINLKKTGIIDAFIYSNTSFEYLIATIKSLVTF